MPKIYSDGDSIEVFAKPLIGPYHPELATARILYVFVSEHSKENGIPKWGSAKKLSGPLEYLLESDFLIEVPLDLWNDAPEAERVARVDHLLECCTGEEDEKTGGLKWVIRKPDVKEFTSIFRRHGLYHDGLRTFASVAKAINIDEMIEEVGIEELSTTEVT